MKRIALFLLVACLLFIPTAVFAQEAMNDLNDAYTGQSDTFEGNPSETNPAPGVPDVGPSGPVGGGYVDSEGNYQTN